MFLVSLGLVDSMPILENGMSPENTLQAQAFAKKRFINSQEVCSEYGIFSVAVKALETRLSFSTGTVISFF